MNLRNPSILASFLTLSLFAARSPGQVATASGKTRTKTETLHFRWPIPAKARVTERTLKRGRKGVTSYLFRLGPDPENKNRWTGGLSDFKILELDTGNATPEQIALGKKFLKATTAALPSLSIDPKTLEAEVKGVRKGVEALLEVLRKTAKTDKDKQMIALLAKSMTSDAMLDTLRESSLTYWNAWAKIWNGLQIPPKGQSRRFKTSMDYPAGGKGTSEVLLTNLGSPKGKPNQIQLKYQQVAGGDVLGALLSLLRKSAPPSIRDRVKKEMFESAKIQASIQVTLDRKTLLPHRVLLEKTMTVKMKGLPGRSRVERHDYSFEWDH